MTVLGDVTQLSASEELHLHLSDAAMPGPRPRPLGFDSEQHEAKQKPIRGNCGEVDLVHVPRGAKLPASPGPVVRTHLSLPPKQISN